MDINSDTYILTAKKILSLQPWYTSYFTVSVIIPKDNTTITIPNTNMNAYVIVWGDTYAKWTYTVDVPEYSHTYEKAGTYRIEIQGATSVGLNAFDGMTNLGEIDFSYSMVETIWNGAFSGTNITTITLPTSLRYCGTAVGGIGAFEGCKSLKEVFIETGTIRIADNAFKDCTSLEYINIPNSVNYIGNNAFAGCASLKDIVIPDSVVSIGDNAFAGCASLKSIRIGKAVRNMGSGIFDGNIELKTVFMEGMIPPTIKTQEVETVSEGASTGIPEQTKIMIVYGFGDDYKIHEGWERYASQIYSEVLYVNDDGDVVQR